MTAPTLKGTVPSLSRVMNAIYELAGAHDRWPTLVELARHLNAAPVDVHIHLLELVAQRKFRERRIDDRQVWLPWDQV